MRKLSTKVDWDKLEKEAEEYHKKHPWRIKLFRLKEWIKNIPWQFRWRFQKKHQYNRINTSLKPGYYDPCFRLTVAIFEEATDFLENSHWDWVSDKEHKKTYKELSEAVNFWKENKEHLQNGDLSILEEEKLDIQKIKHLKNIIENLDSMWY